MWMVPLALATATVMLVAWFPLSTLWRQQSQLDVAANQISALQRQELALSQQAKSISTKAAATQLARQQYQLVNPGQSLIQVLPGSVAGHPLQSSGDPGLQPLVSPSSVSTLVTKPSSTSVAKPSSLRSFVARLVRTLEFWH